MKNLTNLNINKMTAEELRSVARDLSMPGAWKAKKADMIDFIQGKINDQQEEVKEVETQEIEVVQEVIAAEPIQPSINPVESSHETKPEVKPSNSKKGRRRTIEIYKNGILIKTVEGLLNTFAWVKENEITNQGWVKRSLKTGEETNAGWRYKEGGYLFKYAK